MCGFEEVTVSPEPIKTRPNRGELQNVTYPHVEAQELSTEERAIIGGWLKSQANTDNYVQEKICDDVFFNVSFLLLGHSFVVLLGSRTFFAWDTSNTCLNTIFSVKVWKC